MKMMYNRVTAIILLLILSMSILSGCGASESSAKPNPSGGGGLLINEVVSSNAYSLVDPVLGTPDWIELYNSSARAIALGEYRLSDNMNQPDKWTLPSITLQAGEYLMLYAASQVKGASDKNDFCTGFKISSLGETLILTDSSGNVMQELKVPELLTDVSWGKDAKGAFRYFAQPTPGAVNSGEGVDSLDKVVPTVPDGTIRINELMAENRSYITDSDGERFAWVEICNTSSGVVSLKGYFLSDNPSDSKKWQFPDVSLEAGKYLIVFLSGKDRAQAGSELHASFKLGSQEKGLWLIGPAGALEDRIQWQEAPPDDFSLGRDAQGNVKYYGAPTPGEQNGDKGADTLVYNTADPVNSVRINEFLVENNYSKMDADGDRSAWVELYNASTGSANLKNFVLSDDQSDPTKWRFPDITLDPGKYVLVFLSGKDRREADGELHTGFRLSTNDAVLMLTNLEAMESDTVTLPETLMDNVSYGRSAQDPVKWLYYAQPTPQQDNTTKGFDDILHVTALDEDGLWINEVSAVAKVKSGKLDWIEIANGGSKSVNLSGYYLSDDPDEPCKWKIPSIAVAAGGYAVIYTSGASAEQKGNVAAFGLSPAGEELVFSSPDGNVLDVFATGSQKTSVTSGRATGDYTGERVFFTSATPGAANNSPMLSAYAAQPVFSKPGGYASGTVQLEVTCATKDAQIFYTLDGSKPTTSSTLYTGPLNIKNTTVVKAIASRSDLLSSDMTVATYLFEGKHTVPVICLSADSGDFHAVYSVSERPVNVEREAYIEYYEDDGTLGVSFPAGIRVAGAGTLTYPQKSLGVYLRSGYGQSEVTYPFFKDFPYVTFKSLTLRDSGQDFNWARLRDAYGAMASRDMNLDYAEYRLAVVYINGEYWGLYDIRENQNEDYYAYRFNTEPENVERIRRNQTALSGTRDEILAVRSYARSKNMSDDAVFEAFSKKVDTESFMDYIIAQTFFCNADMFNQKFTRAIDYTFKWRPVLYDLDLAMYNSDRNIIGAYFNPAGIPSANGTLTNMDIQHALLSNPGWKEAFIERYAYHLNNTYTQEKLLALLDEMVKEMEPEMKRHIARWGHPDSVNEWKSCVAEVRAFLKDRTKNVKKHLQSQFNLSDGRMTELFPNGY
ncbi:MAG: lamin tail domain-containing protein [Christensenellales bacterium]